MGQQLVIKQQDKYLLNRRKQPLFCDSTQTSPPIPQNSNKQEAENE
jgi:hypothetical protein